MYLQFWSLLVLEHDGTLERKITRNRRIIYSCFAVGGWNLVTIRCPSVWTRIMLVLSYVHFLRVEIPNGANVIAQFCWLNHYCQWNRHCYQVRSWRACKMPWRLPSSQWSTVVPSRSRTRRFCWVDGGGKGCIFRICWAQKAQTSHGNGPVVSRQGSGITGRRQVPKYHAKNYGRRDGHALRPEAGVTSPAHPWRKRLGDCRCKCKQIQAVNRTLFTVDYYYKNRCT